MDLLDMHKQFIRAHLGDGEIAVDFTMGNGNDTEFLSRTVGERGRVFAFDIQEQAVESTRRRLENSDCPKNYTLILDSHAKVKEYVDQPIKAGMFNLGFLPHGDKNITTKRESTMAAIKGGLELLLPDGILLIAVYPGHEEGMLEGRMIEEFIAGLDRFTLCASMFKILNSPTSPYFMMIEKKAK